tara:strand:- start:47 stop:244 length:198 start_codon:yes stop_codon:yes gene_type:complete
MLLVNPTVTTAVAVSVWDDVLKVSPAVFALFPADGPQALCPKEENCLTNPCCRFVVVLLPSPVTR